MRLYFHSDAARVRILTLAHLDTFFFSGDGKSVGVGDVAVAAPAVAPLVVAAAAGPAGVAAAAAAPDGGGDTTLLSLRSPTEGDSSRGAVVRGERRLSEESGCCGGITPKRVLR